MIQALEEMITIVQIMQTFNSSPMKTRRQIQIITKRLLSLMEWFWWRSCPRNRQLWRTSVYASMIDLTDIMRHFEEVVVVFDAYTPDSLKNRTRQNRRKGPDPVPSWRWDQFGSSHEINFCLVFKQKQIWQIIWLRKLWSTTKVLPNSLMVHRVSSWPIYKK